MFRYEKDMREPVRTWMEAQGYTTRDEVYLPWGVCDLVGIHIDQAQVNLRRNARQFTRLSNGDIWWLMFIPPEGFYQEDLADAIYSNVSGWSFKDRLKKLRKRRLIDAEEKHGSLFLTTNIPWLPYHKKIIAVELKLSDTAGVRHQADNHHVFANETWAALPANRVDKMRQATRDKFKSAGIGILSVTLDKCEVVIEPCQYTPKDIYERIRAAFVAECVWQNLRKGH